MSDMLFSLEPDAPIPATAVQPNSIRTDQIVEFRAAFDAWGISDQDVRKTLVKAAIRRKIATMRNLYENEATRVTTGIHRYSPPKERTATGSAWDTREEDTWIDKL